MFVGVVREGKLPDPLGPVAHTPPYSNLFIKCWGTGLSRADECVISSIYQLCIDSEAWTAVPRENVEILSRDYLSEISYNVNERATAVTESLKRFTFDLDIIDIMQVDGIWYVVPKQKLMLLATKNPPYWNTRQLAQN